MKWNIRNENITILGIQGSGKTTLTKEILNSIPNSPRLIISPQRPLSLYGQYGKPINDISELTPTGAHVWIGNTDDLEKFEKLCNKIMTFQNFLVIIDDAHEFATKQQIPKQWKKLINSGRNRGISSIFISPSPNLLHNVILQSSQHLFSFKFAIESQIEYARKNFFGDLGYLLLNKPARPYQYRQYPQMQKHDFLYRFVESEDVEYHYEDGRVLVLSSIEKMPHERQDESEDREANQEIPETVETISDSKIQDKTENNESEPRDQNIITQDITQTHDNKTITK